MSPTNKFKKAIKKQKVLKLLAEGADNEDVDDDIRERIKY